MGVELLGHDEVVYGAVQAGAGEDAVEGALVVVVQLDAHAVPVRQQLLRTHRRTEVHQPRACVLRLLFNCTCTKLSALSLLYKVELDSTDILVDFPGPFLLPVCCLARICLSNHVQPLVEHGLLTPNACVQ